MKPFFIILMFVALSVISVFGQNSSVNDFVCPAKTVEKVSSRGIKIGATIDEALNNFDLSETEKNRIRNNDLTQKNIGYQQFVVNPKSDDRRFEEISDYRFYFLDDKLVSFTAYYKKPKWKDVNQFTETIVKILDLPNTEKWTKQNDVTNSLQCGDYYIGLSLGGAGGGTLTVFDNGTQEILKQRKQKLEDEEREKNIKAFKP